MRFRLTVLLAILNVAVFGAIWMLERDSSNEDSQASALSDFTVLEIEGKTIEKPRVLRFENNRWRIVSPIEWPANFFAINRIRSQLEFLDRQTSFEVSEISKHGQTLADYGLDDPSFIFKYGAPGKMHTLKVGKAAPIGNRIYMLDDESEKIIVVDKELLESLVIDIERLRSQDVFEIPRFEVGAISIRIPQNDGASSAKTKFRRIGLVKDGGKWKFETPIAAGANNMAVDSFLNNLCAISARGFATDSAASAGFDISAFPMTVTLQGTNRRQVLLIGNPVPGTDLVYAKLEDNPTVFTLDSAIFKDFDHLQTTLRDRLFFKFDILDAAGLDIASPSETVRLRSVKSGLWDLIKKGKGSDPETLQADSAITASLLNKLSKLSARDFANDAPGDNLAPYGLNAPKLKITVLFSDQTSKTLLVGSSYKLGGATLTYAALEGEPSIYGIPTDILESFPVNPLYYKSRILAALPEKAALKSLKLLDAQSGRVMFEVAKTDSQDVSQLIAAIPQKRRREMAEVISAYAKKFVVSAYEAAPFSQDGIKLENAPAIPWKWKLVAVAELPGTGKLIEETHEWFFTDIISATLQYGGSAAQNATFRLPQNLIEASFEFTAPALAESLRPPATKQPTPLPAPAPAQPPATTDAAGNAK